MSVDFPTREVREGLASLLVPEVPHERGPGRRTALPFYNPNTVMARDLTSLVVRSYVRPGATVLDGLAATGVLGIRMALEAGKDLAITWNDKNPHAHKLILASAARNGVSGEVLRKDLREILAGRRWDFVDIDPFGTPVPFVDAAVQQARKGAGLGFTATDTAPLAGTYPQTCWRRYGARSMRTPCGAETALRIFMGYLVRIAASHDRGLRPLLLFAASHFLKALVAVDQSREAADQCLAQLGYVRFDGARFEVHGKSPREPYAGPLWLGPLAEAAPLADLAPRMETRDESARLLERLRAEAFLSPFFYENHALARTLGLDPVPVASWLDALRSAGFRATRPHVTANAVKTDAPWEDVVRTYRDLEPR